MRTGYHICICSSAGEGLSERLHCKLVTTERGNYAVLWALAAVAAKFHALS